MKTRKYNRGLRTVQVEAILNEIVHPCLKNNYPLEKGERYYTYENNRFVFNTWDEDSEDLHNKNPEQKYYVIQH